MINDSNNNIKLGSLFIIFSALSFSIMEIAVKISGSNIPVMEQVFARNFITLFISAFVMIRDKERPFPNKSNILSIVCRSVSGYLGIICYFYATNNNEYVQAGSNLIVASNLGGTSHVGIGYQTNSQEILITPFDITLACSLRDVTPSFSGLLYKSNFTGILLFFLCFTLFN